MIPECNRAPVAMTVVCRTLRMLKRICPPCGDRGTLAGGEAANHFKRHPLDNLYKASAALVDELRQSTDSFVSFSGVMRFREGTRCHNQTRSCPASSIIEEAPEYP